jgi:hypothetical protein
VSVLLSAYYPEGIVFAADKNATITYIPSGIKHVEPTATKVLSWPFQKAIVGFVGLGRLAGRLMMDEWMRIFIAETRELDDIDRVAHRLRDRVQEDFDKDYPAPADTRDKHLVIHFGGFAARNGIQTPVMYHIWNHGDIDLVTGYPPADRNFRISEDIERDFRAQTKSSNYPAGVRDWLTSKINVGEYHWYNNGANLAAFNTFKNVIWRSLRALQDAGFAPSSSGSNQGISFCKMAVEVFGSFFTHYFPPEEQAVGGGVDVAYILWPK